MKDINRKKRHAWRMGKIHELKKKVFISDESKIMLDHRARSTQENMTRNRINCLG